MAKPKKRPANPRPMRVTERDKALLQFIYDHEGLVSRRQLAKVFFGGNEDWAKHRLLLLFENGYLNQPDDENMHRVPRGQWIYWLDRLGLELVAGLHGEEPLHTDKLRTNAPQWAKIEHDLAVNEFRLLVQDALLLNPALALAEWVNERTLTHWADEVTWKQPNGRDAKKKFAMDGFFKIRHTVPGKERPDLFAYLLEIDRGRHSNPAFADEKIRPGIVYITSPVYEARFGVKFGRYLVVTLSEERMDNMLRQAERIAGGELFYFTTAAALTPETVFAAPIWHVPGKDKPIALIPSLQPRASSG